MGYSHCDLHDEDATNGCDSCTKERLEGLKDWEVIRQSAYLCSLDDRRTHERILEIAERMRIIQGP